MKYEPVFGDQSLFDGAPDDAEIAAKSDGGIAFFPNQKPSSKVFFVSGVELAMRRIIAEPKRWTWEDKKAGRLPEVGCFVEYFKNNKHDNTEVTAQWRNGDELEILRHQNKNEAFVVFNARTEESSDLIVQCMKPIETPEEKAERLRMEWCSKAAKTLKNLEYSSTLTSLYDSLLSGELESPIKMKGGEQ